MSHLAAVRGVLPEHSYAQADVTAAFADVLGSVGPDRALLERFHANAGVSQRHLALPLERYWELDGFGEANDEFIRVATELGSHAVTKVLAAAGLTPRDVDLIMSTTITGLAVPSIEARVAAEIGLRDDVKRVPLVGLGCVAGAAGVARVHDYLLGHPDDVAVLLSVELCCLTVQRDDRSVANLVASGLFGDGAAAVVMVGAQPGRGPGAPASRASSPRAAASTPRPSGPWAGTSAPRDCASSSAPRCPTSCARTCATTSTASSPTTG